MKSWQERLSEVMGGQARTGLTEEDRRIIRAAISSFAGEFLNSSRRAAIEDRQDAIGLRITDSANDEIEMELLVHFSEVAKISVFSKRVVVADFQIGDLMDGGEEDVLNLLVQLYEAARHRVPILIPND